MALEEDIGIVVREANPLKLREKLNALRKQDPMFAMLSLVLSPDHPENELWIIRSKRERPVEEPTDGEEV